MTAKIEDYLSFTVSVNSVQLLSTSEQLERFLGIIGAEVQAFDDDEERDGNHWQISKERIRLDLRPSHSTISQDYPETPKRLLEVAWAAISLAEVEAPLVFSVAVNAVLTQDEQETANKYLVEHFVQTNFYKHMQLIGSSGRFIFSDDENARWFVTLEPRFNSATEKRIYVSINLIAVVEEWDYETLHSWTGKLHNGLHALATTGGK